MKKVLSIMAVSAFVLTAGVALAGGPGKKMDSACPEECQQQIDDLQSSQAQQNEELGAHSKQLENHEGRITALEQDAYDPWFVRAGLRGAWVTADVRGVFDEQDSDGFGGAIAFGREFGQFRAELELAYQKTDADTYDTLVPNFNNMEVVTIDHYAYDVDTKLTTIMVNGYYEVPVYDALSVYGMVGVGYAKYDLDINLSVNGSESVDIGGSDNVFAYKAGVGVSYAFNEQMAADLGYEYLGVADTDLATSINGHNVVASVRFKF